MKSDDIYASAEFVRSLTPFGLIIASLIIALSAIASSEKLINERFAVVLGVATGLASAAAGGYSPQQRQQPQNRIDADRVDIDQSK